MQLLSCFFLKIQREGSYKSYDPIDHVSFGRMSRGSVRLVSAILQLE
jgi:hypothetical protein